MHAEPAGLGEDYAESFAQGTATARAGSYHAPFTGIHGWFWENRSGRDIEVRLYTAGFYYNSTVFSGSVEYDPLLNGFPPTTLALSRLSILAGLPCDSAN